MEYTVKDILKYIYLKNDCFVLKSFKTHLILYKFNGEFLIPIKEFKLKYPWHVKKIHDNEFTQIYFYILINYNIELVQIDHLLFHSLDLPHITKTLNIPTLLNIHDFYYICPKIFLLDADDKYCGGIVKM